MTALRAPAADLTRTAVSTDELLLKGWVTSNEVARPRNGRAGTGPDRESGGSQVGSQSMGQYSITEPERETA